MRMNKKKPHPTAYRILVRWWCWQGGLAPQAPCIEYHELDDYFGEGSKIKYTAK